MSHPQPQSQAPAVTLPPGAPNVLIDEYPQPALVFVQEGLAYTVRRIHGRRKAAGSRHVTGEQLCHGLREYAIDRYGLLAKTSLTVRIKDSRLVDAHSNNRSLREDFWAYTHTDQNSDRVGEFAIGTNMELREVIGHILQDEKFPGIHIAFGNPYGAHTGADWYSSTHIDVVGTRFDIWVDDRQIMADGKFLIEM